MLFANIDGPILAVLQRICSDHQPKEDEHHTNIICQGTSSSPSITINDYELEVVEEFTYLGSTLTNDLSLDSEINKRIGKASTTFSRLPRLLCIVPVSSACFCMAASHGLPMRDTRRNYTTFVSDVYTGSSTYLGKIRSQSPRAGLTLTSIYTLLRQCRLHWLGHVSRMDDGRIPNDILYGELASGKRTTGRPKLRYRNVCKKIWRPCRHRHRVLGKCCSKSSVLEKYHQQVYLVVSEAIKLRANAADKRTRRKQSTSAETDPTIHKCNLCYRDCHSRIGLYSHKQRCGSKSNYQDDLSIVNIGWRKPTRPTREELASNLSCNGNNNTGKKRKDNDLYKTIMFLDDQWFIKLCTVIVLCQKPIRFHCISARTLYWPVRLSERSHIEIILHLTMKDGNLLSSFLVERAEVLSIWDAPKCNSLNQIVTTLSGHALVPSTLLLSDVQRTSAHLSSTTTSSKNRELDYRMDVS